MNRVLIALLISGCSSTETTGPSDVTGPFTGTPRTYLVDRIDLPIGELGTEMAADLDGDDRPDNSLATAVANVFGTGNGTTHGLEMIASGRINSSLVIVADDLTDDPTVSVSYFGQPTTTQTPVGGRFVDGRFISNRTATTMVPGLAVVWLPVFADADASMLPIVGLEMELTPDGAGGFDVYLHGGVPAIDALDEAARGLESLIAARPSSHHFMRSLFDKAPQDWHVTRDEIAMNQVISWMFEPDMTLFDTEVVSFGFRVHVSPCGDGDACARPPLVEPCHDGIRDGEESDVDCGGSCRACTTNKTCGAPTDCDSEQCDAGLCGLPSCTDGLRDGFETDVDCGGPCPACDLDDRCWDHDDCATNQCGAPCTDPDPLSCAAGDTGYDTCRAAP